MTVGSVVTWGISVAVGRVVGIVVGSAVTASVVGTVVGSIVTTTVSSGEGVGRSEGTMIKGCPPEKSVEPDPSKGIITFSAKTGTNNTDNIVHTKIKP